MTEPENDPAKPAWLRPPSPPGRDGNKVDAERSGTPDQSVRRRTAPTDGGDEGRLDPTHPLAPVDPGSQGPDIGVARRVRPPSPPSDVVARMRAYRAAHPSTAPARGSAGPERQRDTGPSI